MARRSLAATILLCAVLTPHLHAREAVCHIHAPDDYTPFSNQPLVIPSVGDRTACEQLNRERFGSRGRCHCTQDAIGMERRGPMDFRRMNEQPGQLP
ncbi:MAG: hypothetical protein KME56_02800 [Candidatus Thiodiazotropha sp. (ex Ctena orbiculata)]|uniref:Secreted protein n=1 Tax=Candidatus Thiodiazotropha taylori TaxID=2792791 RepID=A0A944MC83_9GAMM|nr:hypothetical protein [Candidatus Thiodiazotropha taylori]MBT2989243.1 hypothetical protein [Candidatus Thiodiazotropha taylori]MBT2995546.1 hypothetical protein [Candidatus Thiodiazotropha taylori]MBT2999500.1 hypothetical protein [Candidatus Thiodiazotropha taylori]MBT3025732.1 hypothetical protein [Candidatus Thiodiazotropha taylori]